MKALMFGGAFNPPTRAHVELAYHAMKECGREAVVFVPSKMQYIRDDQKKDFSFTDDERLAMLRKAAEGKDWMIVEDYELNCETQPRSYTTLQYLKSKGYDCSLLFGSDKLPELESGWKHVPEIAGEFGIVCMTRNHDDCRQLIDGSPFLSELKESITLIETPDLYQEISSTAVRKHFLNARKEIEALKNMIPEELDGLKEYL